MKKYIFLVFLPLAMYSCKNNSENGNSDAIIANKKYEKIEQLEWLLGTWIHDSGTEFSQESWSKENDSTFTGFSFTQVGEETVFAETMALEQKGDRFLLTVAAANEDGSSPVTFRFTSSENGHFAFENKSNAFPERITYSNPAKDSLHAWIEGRVNDESKKVEFNFSRKD